ncbi:sodium:solute symporter [Flavobacteriaceae bacterium Ap0902]|nr:sodium:solute symporter [Flavobacteriaceae bacterium Ap0902]
MLTPLTIALLIGGYFALLLIISYFTSKSTDKNTFFTGNRKSPWMVVSYGMIGAALSAVTFVSIPGSVAVKGFYAAQFFMGNMVGYLFITFVLIPLYYKLNLVSIYSYLENRFGWFSYKTGSFFFIVSQSFGAGLRMLLAIKILQVLFGLDDSHMWWLAVIFLILIFLYTFKAGIKTIVWTDMLQTTFLLLAALAIVWVIFGKMELGVLEIIDLGKQKGYWKWFDFDVKSGTYFWKQFIAGMLIAMAMMGLDQNMMQKSLTCKNVREAQKNTFVFSFSVAIAQILFLFLGMMLFLFADVHSIDLPTKTFTQDGEVVTAIATDKVLPFLTLNYFGIFASVMFVLGTAAAAFSSVDSALTALTTSFAYDFLGIEKRKNPKTLKTITHIGFSVLMLIIILIFSRSGNNVFDLIFGLAGYTYAPLLGLFLIGIFTKIKLNDKTVPIAALATPVIAYFLNEFLLNNYGFNIGFLTIFTGASITIILLLLFSLIPSKK